MKKERKGMERLFVIGILFFCFNFLNIHPIAETRPLENNGGVLSGVNADELGLNVNERFRRVLEQEKDLSVIEDRIQKWNINVNTKNDQGYTFLHLAIIYNRGKSVLNLLIEKGANVNARTFEEGLTPLHLAAGYHREKAILDLLIQKGADVNARTFKGGVTPLLLVAGYKEEMERIEVLIHFGHYERIHRIRSDTYDKERKEKLVSLVRNGAQVNKPAKNGITALHLLAFSNNLGAMEYLIKNGANVYASYGDALFYKKKGVTPFHLAVLHDGVAAMQVFLSNKEKFDINVRDSWDRTPLHWAVKYSSMDVIKYLVQNGADVNAQFVDVIDNFKEKLFYLDDYGYYISQSSRERFFVSTVSGRTALHEAARFQTEVAESQTEAERVKAETERIRYLLENGADLKITDEHGSTPLHRAAFYNTKAVVQYIVEEALKTKFDVALRDGKGNTFLHYAAFKNSLEVIKYFVEQGSDFKSTNGIGTTTLMKAAFYNSLDVLKYFHEVGQVDVGATNLYGETALFNAAAYNIYGVVEHLVDRLQADIFTQNRQGITPLFFAAAENTLDVVKYLDQKDQSMKNILLADEDGFNLLHYAALHNTSDVVEYIVLKYVVKYSVLDINALSGEEKEDEDDEEEGRDIRSTPFLRALTMNTVDTVNVIDSLFSQGGRMSILLKGNDDFHARDPLGNTPLHYSLVFGSFDVIQYLVEGKKAPLNALNSMDQTPLMYAAMRAADLQIEPKILEYLLQKGADVHLKDGQGDTVLHWFARGIADSIYGVRLENWINRDWVNRLSSHSIISIINSFESLVALVRKGADGNVRNRRKKTAIEKMGSSLENDSRYFDTGYQILLDVFEGITTSCNVRCDFWWDPFFE